LRGRDAAERHVVARIVAERVSEVAIDGPAARQQVFAGHLGAVKVRLGVPEEDVADRIDLAGDVVVDRHPPLVGLEAEPLAIELDADFIRVAVLRFDGQAGQDRILLGVLQERRAGGQVVERRRAIPFVDAADEF
jgi:hypothetical protein